MTNSKVVHLSIHGGMGNQLYQLYAGVLLATSLDYDLVIHTHLLARYTSPTTLEVLDLIPKSIESRIFISAKPPACLLGQVRLAKLLSKLSNNDVILRDYRGSIYMDSYFQAVRFYAQYQPALLKRILIEVMSAFDNTDLRPSHFRLLHIRLGDFFKTKVECHEHVLKVLKSDYIPHVTRIITNDRKTVCRALAKQDISDNCLIETDGLPAKYILNIMMGFREIHSNGSSLALWAAVFSKSSLYTCNRDHANFYSFVMDSIFGEPIS